jgi:hypothetical protein
LRAKPAILGLTDGLVGLSDEQWRRNVERLRGVRLLAPRDPSDPEALDAHPLVREWFGERLRTTNDAVWKAAHGRLYEHLRDTTYEGKTPTLPDLTPLYHAIAHGCRAARYQEAFDEIYLSRICRRKPDGKIESYATKKLGAVDSDLAAIAWFFDHPYHASVAGLTPLGASAVLGLATYGLRAQGRLGEALPAMRSVLSFDEQEQSWGAASISATNLAETELLFGDIAGAAATAERAVAFADRRGNRSFMAVVRATHADILLAGGERERSEVLFVDAEHRQREWRPENVFLYSVWGYQYCDLLISAGRGIEAKRRAAQTLKIARQNRWLQDIALDNLTLGRAHFALALARQSRYEPRAAIVKLDESVVALRTAGANHYLPRGLLARAAFRRAIGDWDGAKRDLCEAKEIAESGLMRLYWCDCALERARLALARREAFAPLNAPRRAKPPAAGLA